MTVRVEKSTFEDCIGHAEKNINNFISEKQREKMEDMNTEIRVKNALEKVVERK